MIDCCINTSFDSSSLCGQSYPRTSTFVLPNHMQDISHRDQREYSLVTTSNLLTLETVTTALLFPSSQYQQRGIKAEDLLQFYNLSIRVVCWQGNHDCKHIKLYLLLLYSWSWRSVQLELLLHFSSVKDTSTRCKCKALITFWMKARAGWQDRWG